MRSTTPQPTARAPFFTGVGGTVTLNLGMDRNNIKSFDGQLLANFKNDANSIKSQAIYHGSAYDYLVLNDGREIYFQGIDILQFKTPADILQVQVLPNESIVSPNQPKIADISQQFGDETEPDIAVNPSNTLQIFVAANDNTNGVGIGGSPGQLFGALSIDGGVTWATKGGIATGGVGAWDVDSVTGQKLPISFCDPSVAWDTFGNLFVAYLDILGNAVLLESSNGGINFTIPGQNDVWTVDLGTPKPTAGNFKLNVNGQNTGNIAFNAPANSVQAAIAALPAIAAIGGAANVSVTSPNATGGPYTITFQKALAGSPQFVTLAASSLNLGVVTVANPTAGARAVWPATDQEKVTVGANSVWLVWNNPNPANPAGPTVLQATGRASRDLEQ